MLRPTERFAVGDTNCFKQAVSVKETAIKHRNHRLFFGHELAIEENGHRFPIPGGQASPRVQISFARGRGAFLLVFFPSSGRRYTVTTISGSLAKSHQSWRLGCVT